MRTCLYLWAAFSLCVILKISSAHWKIWNSINTLELQSNYFLFQSIKAGFEMKQFHHRNSKGKLNEISSKHLKPIDIYIFKETVHLKGSSIQAVCLPARAFIFSPWGWFRKSSLAWPRKLQQNASLKTITALYSSIYIKRTIRYTAFLHTNSSWTYSSHHYIPRLLPWQDKVQEGYT